MLRPAFASTHRELCILSVKDKQEESIEMGKGGRGYAPEHRFSPCLRFAKRDQTVESGRVGANGLDSVD
jgi:hypothetical protein